MTAEEKLNELDDYKKASTYLIGEALTHPDGFMLRAIKSLMDEVSRLQGDET